MTEDLETKERIISLGKTIVQELKIEPGVDTLSRWMAHYVAELIVKAEKAPREEKAEFEKECFETILKVWKRRSSFPNGRRPFEEFEPIFDTLEYLSKETGNSFRSQLPDFMREDDFEENNEVYSWLRKTVDASDFMKRLQRFCLSEAYYGADNERTKKWLEHVKDPDLYEDTKALFELKWYSKEFYEMSEDEQQKEKNRRGLNSFLSGIKKEIGSLNEIKNIIEERLNKSE